MVAIVVVAIIAAMMMISFVVVVMVVFPAATSASFAVSVAATRTRSMAMMVVMMMVGVWNRVRMWMRNRWLVGMMRRTATVGRLSVLRTRSCRFLRRIFLLDFKRLDEMLFSVDEVLPNFPLKIALSIC